MIFFEGFFQEINSNLGQNFFLFYVEYIGIIKIQGKEKERDWFNLGYENGFGYIQRSFR